MALSAIPVVGGAAKELFNTVIAPPLAKRQAEWMESIAERLEMLEKQVAGFKIESLSTNSLFGNVSPKNPLMKITFSSRHLNKLKLF
jgi:hypothetical protein